MKNRLLHLGLACALGLSLAGASASAIPVTWSAPVDLQGQNARQVLTTPPGTVVGAVSFGQAEPIIVDLGNHVTPIVFGKYSDPTTASIISSSPLTRATGPFASGSGHAGLDAVLSAYASGQGPLPIKLINLVGGETYSVQLFVESKHYLLGNFTVPAGSTSVTLSENLPSSPGRLNALVVRALSFKPAIAFTLQPTDASTDVGATASFSALAIGPSPMVAKWQAGPAGGPYRDLKDDGRISGSDSYHLQIAKFGPGDASKVYVLKLSHGGQSTLSRETNVRMFGNAGPVYNIGPTDDVNFWILQAYYSGGGTVHLAAGTYRTSVNMYPNVTLQGSGMGVTTIVGLLTQGQYGDNMSMSDLTVSGGISASSYSQGGYPPAGIFFGAYYPNDSHNLSWKNVEVKGTNIAMQLINVAGCNLDSCNFHDNALGFSHTIYFTGDYGINMTNCIASWGFTGAGAHLDFSQNIGVSNNFTQCEFNGSTGNGILNQNYNGATNDIQIRGTKIQFCGQSGGEGSGVDTDGNGSIQTSRIDFNHGNGVTVRNGVGLFYDTFFGNSSGPYFSYGPVANVVTGTSPNVYDAVQADGVCGANNTADWVTNLGGAAEGTVVFTTGTHPVNGSITFPIVGAPAAGTYPLQFVYANGLTSTVSMTLTVNGVAQGSISFPPTANSSTYAVSTVNAALTGASNSVRLDVISPGPGTPVLNALIVNASTPSAPDALTGLTATANRNAPRDDLVTWIDLAWTPAARATYYNIYRNGLLIAVGVPTTTFTDKHILGCNATYSYTVGPVNAGGGGATATVTGVSITAFPLSCTANSLGKAIAVSCPSVPNGQSYNVYRATTSGGPYTKIATVTSPSYLDVSVTTGTTYYYVMTAFNGLSESLNSPEANASPYNSYAGAPVLIDVDFGSGAAQTGAAVLGATGDKWNTLSGNTTTIVNAANTTLSGVGLTLSAYGTYTDTGGTAMDTATNPLMQDYAFGYNSTPNINVSLTGLSAYRGANLSLVVYAAGDTNGQGNNLLLASGTSGGNTSSSLSTTGASRSVSAGLGVAYNTFNGALTGNTLALTASALSGQSFTTLNGFQLQLTAPTTLPAAPTGVTASVTNGVVSLTWSSVSGAGYYLVKRSTVSGSSYTTLGGTQGTSFTDATGAFGLTYYYLVTAVNNAGESAASAEKVVNTASLPSPFQSQSIGTVSNAGTVSYASSNSTYTVSSTGSGLTGTADAYRMVYDKLTGDCQIIARVATVSAASQTAQTGVVIRETLAPGSASVSEVLTPANLAQVVSRSATNGTASIAASATATGIPYWVKLRRVGNVITGYHSANGTAWTTTGSVTVPMAATVYLGLAVGGGGGSNSATFDNVSDGVLPAAPANLQAISSDSQVLLNWSSVPGGPSYTVKRSSALAGPFTTLASGLTTTTYTNTGLTNGTTYYYTVSATIGSIESADAPVVSSTPAILTNNSFEAQTVADNSYSVVTPTGWTTFGVTGAVVALVNPGASDGRGYGATPAGLNGNNYAQIFAYQSGGSGVVYQYSSQTYKAGATYQLKAAIGKENGSFATGSTLSMWNSNGVLIASTVINAASLVQGAFTDVTLTYTATGNEGGNGQILVGFTMPTTNTSSAFLDVDNVRLLVTRTFASAQKRFFTPNQLADPRVSAAEADANGDGVSNLLAVALGLNPMEFANTHLPALGVASNHLTLTYTRFKGATEWNYVAEVSSDLKEWQSGAAYITQVSVRSLSDTLEQVTVQDNAAINDDQPHFMRLKVTLP